ncbi:hypothetical protein CTA1_9512 [Colletotrichum tanaceti]|uniref:Uncharacterized protein n=1 Tax=Colletotrichum tanaceti TaxID=1306861 RepID=A0A4V6DH71_9PEZI|nr:hypothetical protein CTA1_9512 [Colletotrichum tanaceti]
MAVISSLSQLTAHQKHMCDDLLTVLGCRNHPIEAPTIDQTRDEFWNRVFKSGWNTSKPNIAPAQLQKRTNEESALIIGTLSEDVPKNGTIPSYRRAGQPVLLKVSMKIDPQFDVAVASFFWVDQQGHRDSELSNAPIDIEGNLTLKEASIEVGLHYDANEMERVGSWNWAKIVHWGRARLINLAQGKPIVADEDVEEVKRWLDLLTLGKYPELYTTGKVAENVKELLMDMAYQRTPDGGQVAYNDQGAVCSHLRSAKFRRQYFRGEACYLVPSTTTNGPPTSASAPPTPTRAPTRAPPTPTSAPPPPPPSPPPPEQNALCSLEKQVGADTTTCFPTTGFSTTAGTTYGFSFDVDAGMLVSIQTGSTGEGYHQSRGPWTGTFYAESGSALEICATGTGSSGSLPLTFAITEEPSQPVKAPPGKEVFRLDEKVAAGATSCFPTTGLSIREGDYGFSYTTTDGVIVQIGDSSAGPKYFSGNRASGAGLMYIDFSGGSISTCATNSGSAETSLSLSLTQ